MKQILLIVLSIATVLGLHSCCKNKGTNNNTTNDLTLDKSYAGIRSISPSDSSNFELIKSLGIYSINPPLELDTFATLTDVFLSANGSSREKIKSVTASSLYIEILNNPSQTLDFMDTIRVYIDSFNGTSPQLVAYKNDVPLGLRNLSLDVNPTDFKNYFKADFCKILLGGHLRGNNYKVLGNTEFKFNCGFRIVAAP